jgi:hypothetical protein
LFIDNCIWTEERVLAAWVGFWGLLGGWWKRFEWF